MSDINMTDDGNFANAFAMKKIGVPGAETTAAEKLFNATAASTSHIQADVLKAVCDTVVNCAARGRKPKEIRLGDAQWEKFIAQCDKRAILDVRIVHLRTPSAFEVIR